MTKEQYQDFLAIIPARYASVRFPGKMLAPILGKSLLQHTYENACKAIPSEKILIAADDQRIFDHAVSFGANVVMTSIGCVNGTERLAEVCRNQNHALRIVLNIQGDEPCLAPEALKATIQALIDSPDAVMSTAVVPIMHADEAYSPSIVKCVFNKQNYAVYFSRALIPGNQHGQFKANERYYRHLGIYAYRPDFLETYVKLENTPLQEAENLEQLKVLEMGYKIKVAVVESSCIGVDTPEDIPVIEKYICKQNSFL